MGGTQVPLGWSRGKSLPDPAPFLPASIPFPFLDDPPSAQASRPMSSHMAYGNLLGRRCFNDSQSVAIGQRLADGFTDPLQPGSQPCNLIGRQNTQNACDMWTLPLKTKTHKRHLGHAVRTQIAMVTHMFRGTDLRLATAPACDPGGLCATGHPNMQPFWGPTTSTHRLPLDPPRSAQPSRFPRA